MKRKIVITVLTVGVLGMNIIGVSNAVAQSPQGDMSTLAQKIADKFKLNKDQVQAVFEEDRKEHIAQMQANYEKKLDEFVKQGKITEAQKQLIINKNKELQAKHEANMQKRKEMTKDQLRADLEQEKQSLESWAKQNGIDITYMRVGHGFMHKHGMK